MDDLVIIKSSLSNDIKKLEECAYTILYCRKCIKDCYIVFIQEDEICNEWELFLKSKVDFYSSNMKTYLKSIDKSKIARLHFIKTDKRINEKMLKINYMLKLVIKTNPIILRMDNEKKVISTEYICMDVEKMDDFVKVLEEYEYDKGDLENFLYTNWDFKKEIDFLNIL